MQSAHPEFRERLFLTAWLVLALLAIALLGSVYLQPQRLSGEPLPLDGATRVSLEPGPAETVFARVFELISPSVPFLVVCDEDSRDCDCTTNGERSGSGLVVHEAGFLVTNAHVVTGASSVCAFFEDGRDFQAQIFGIDRLTDLAVLRVETVSSVPVPPLGDSDALRVGEFVMALGAPFGLRASGTRGIVSGLNRRVGLTTFERFIVTDAAINQGNSGGPLVNMRGEVVGINTAMLTERGEAGTRGSSSIGFAIPINLVKQVAGSLIASRGVVRSYVGFFGIELDEERARAMGLDSEHGFLVLDVVEDGPAAKAGIQTDDVLVSVDGRPIDPDERWREALGERTPGTRVEVEVVRDGERLTLEIELGAWPEEEESEERSGATGRVDPLARRGEARRRGTASATARAPQADPPVVQIRPLDERGRVLARGSGIVLDQDGTILTAAHVIIGAARVLVGIPGGESVEATVAGSDSRLDLAVLRVDGGGAGFVAVPLGESGTLRVGDPIAALSGLVEGERRRVEGELLERAFRHPGVGSSVGNLLTSARIEPGFSGGPLVHDGLVYGMMVAEDVERGGSLALPIDLLRRAADDLLSVGYLRRSTAGIAVVARGRAGTVVYVWPGGPGAEAGIEDGDRILAIDGTQVRDFNEMWETVSVLEPGTELELTIERGDRVFDVSIELIEDTGSRPSVGR